MAASIPKELIEKWKSETATKTERDFEMDLWTEDSANRICLKELIAHMEERRVHVDKAFLYPEEHRFPEDKEAADAQDALMSAVWASAPRFSEEEK